MEILKYYKYEILSIASLIAAASLVYRSKFKINNLMKTIINTKIEGKIVIITGANTGIGKETALDLARRGACVILACRDLNKAVKTQKYIIKSTKNTNVFVEFLDLSRLDSVKEFFEIIIKKYERVDILINNAGVMSCPKWITEDGFEYQFQVNYLSHYLLTRLLLEKLTCSQEARVINLISKLYESGNVNWNDLNFDENYVPINAYKQSKLCNILFTNELQDYLEENSIDNIQVFSVSPGIVLTELGRYFLFNKTWLHKIIAYLIYPILWILLKTPRQGAECSIYCAVKENLKPKKGFYFRDCKEIMLKSNAFKKDDSSKIWNLSDNFVKKWLKKE